MTSGTSSWPPAGCIGATCSRSRAWPTCSDPEGWGRSFASPTGLPTLWRLWATWQADGPRPSKALGIDYPWVARDLDGAVHLLGSRVRKAYEKAIEEERERRGKGKTLTDDDRDEVWDVTVHRIIHKRIRFHKRSAKKGPGGAMVHGAKTIIDKPITGDPLIDKRAGKGARRVLDEDGRLIREYDAGGNVVRERR